MIKQSIWYLLLRPIPTLATHQRPKYKTDFPLISFFFFLSLTTCFKHHTPLSRMSRTTCRPPRPPHPFCPSLPWEHPCTPRHWSLWHSSRPAQPSQWGLFCGWPSFLPFSWWPDPSAPRVEMDPVIHGRPDAIDRILQIKNLHRAHYDSGPSRGTVIFYTQ